MKSLKFRWVAVTATDDFPVAMAPVRRALQGIAPVRIVSLPFRPLSEAEEKRIGEAFRGAAGILLLASALASRN